jgi:hypothetical protein
MIKGGKMRSSCRLPKNIQVRLSRGAHKYIRKEKAKINRSLLSAEKKKDKMKELYLKFS